MSRVLVLGNATVDVIQRVERLPRPGETLLSRGVLRCAGGKGLNQAVAAARTGTAVALVAPMGRDMDAALLAHALAPEPGLQVDWLVRDLPTDFSAIWVSPDGENMIVSTAGCAGSVTVAEAEDVCARLAPGDILLMQGNLPADVTLAAAQTARVAGARSMLNTAPIAWDMRAVLGDFDIVVANEGEAAALDMDAAPGLGITIVTRGSRGAILMEGADTTIIAAPKVLAVDTAGAGDVMLGTLAGLLGKGLDLRAALAVAVAAASLSVTRHGTTPSFPTYDELAALADRTVV